MHIYAPLGLIELTHENQHKIYKILQFTYPNVFSFKGNVCIFYVLFTVSSEGLIVWKSALDRVMA